MSSKHTKLKFGEMVRDYRLKKGWTQRDLADALGYSSPQFVSLIESGKSKVPMNVMGKLIFLVGMPEEKIIKSILSDAELNIRSEIAEGKKEALHISKVW